MAYYGTAQDEFVTIDGVQFAYRRFGATHGVPLLLLMHFRGTMDHWDPALVDTLGAARPVLLADNAGVGRSDGEVPKTFAGWAQHYIDILGALGIEQADVLGFSMGGCVAQLVALNAPQLVRRLVLCGTTPSTGPGVVGAPLGPFNQLKAAATQDEHRAAFLATFFNDSPESQAAGAASWERITTSRAHRVDYVGPESSHRQAVAFAKFMDPKQAENGSYNRLKELKMPVLIANGNNDLLLPESNSITMWMKMNHGKAQLHLYPDSGHGFLYQHGPQFAKLVNVFLDEPERESGEKRSARL
jgi:pimeloyl-ACP methyl ester carboxylesterase